MREAFYTEDLGFAREDTQITEVGLNLAGESSCVVIHSQNERELTPDRRVYPS